MLNGKVAIVTGSTSGIGLGIAKIFAENKAQICCNGLGSESDIQNMVAQLQAMSGTHVIYHPADMSKPDEIADLVHTTHAKFGRIDIFVNNAGIQHVAPIEDFPGERYEAIMRINLSSVFYAMKAVVPLMKQQKFGRIINISSAHGLVASPFKSAYVAAKHGVLGLTKSVALETAEHGITCNAICPGYVLTPLVKHQIADTAKAKGIPENKVIQDVMLANQPTKQFVTIEQVAELVKFLSSDSSSSITGASFSIDGGWTAH